MAEVNITQEPATTDNHNSLGARPKTSPTKSSRSSSKEKSVTSEKSEKYFNSESKSSISENDIKVTTTSNGSIPRAGTPARSQRDPSLGRGPPTSSTGNGMELSSR